MEPICHIPNSVKGIEVLFFPDAEVIKMKGDNKSFATFGSLSVLYFKDYNRFVLQINDWRYPLLRRLATSSTGNGSYTLPAMNGASYQLKINTMPGQSLANLDSLLEGTRKLEKSPEEKLVRPTIHKKETGPKEVITQTINQFIHKVQNKAATLKTGTKNLTSTRKKLDLKSIKTKNFKKDSHSRIKKDFFKSSEKVSSEFLQKRRDNMNMSQARDMDALRKFTDGPAMYLPKDEIEECILLGKDIFTLSSPMDPVMGKPEEKRGIMGTLRQGMDSLRNRGQAAPEVHAEKMPVVEHYQG